MNATLFAAFLALSLVLFLTPGPIVTLVITTTVRGGLRAGLTTVLGTTIGNMVLLTAIALGLAYVLEHAANLFEILRIAGAAYLIYLGVQTWRGAGKSASSEAPRTLDFWRGVIVAITNPKAIAFFTAFLPQFVDPALPADFQLFAMCAASVVMGGATDSSWAIMTSFGRDWFAAPGRTKLLGRVSGAALIGGGLWLSLARRT